MITFCSRLQAPLVLSVVLLSGCSVPAALNSSAMKVSAPVDGVCTVNCVGKVSDTPGDLIWLRPKGSSDTRMARIENDGTFAPVKVGPVSSGDTIEAFATRMDTFGMTKGPVAELKVP